MKEMQDNVVYLHIFISILIMFEYYDIWNNLY